MMGKNHVNLGALLCLAGGTGLPPQDLALLAVLGAGYSVLNDIDHPDSGVSRCLGPLTRATAWLVGKASGGHRNGTHSLVGAAVFTLLAFAAAAMYAESWQPLAVGAVIAVVEVALGWVIGARLDHGRRRQPAYLKPWHGVAALATLALLAALLAVGAFFNARLIGAILTGTLIVLPLAALLRAWRWAKRFLDKVGPFGILDELFPFLAALGLVLGGADLTVVPYALAAGVLAHIAGDVPTMMGCPLGWPWSQRNVSTPWRFLVNSDEEEIVGRFIVAGIAVALFLHVGGVALVIHVWTTLAA
jgi:membrane-bound metal-dependent hydrolase YbcI (DUF457 family)